MNVRVVHPDPSQWPPVVHGRERQGAVKGVSRALQDGQDSEIKLKDLRDTAVTTMNEAGLSIQQIASVTGHTFKSVVETLKR